MASLEIKIEGLGIFDTKIANIAERLKQEQDKFGLNVVRDAQQLVPVDEGRLKASISHKTSGDMVEITANTNYAAYIEFGTRGYAEKYVSQLPQDWQTFARQYKGKIGGGTEELLKNLTEWVLRKGLQTGGKRSKKGQNDAYNIAYVIALKILRNGIKPQPYLYPAVNNHYDNFKEALKKLLQ